MRKFTTFTLILSVVVIVFAADIFVNEYLPKFRKDGGLASLNLPLPDSFNFGGEDLAVNVLGADFDASKVEGATSYDGLGDEGLGDLSMDDDVSLFDMIEENTPAEGIVIEESNDSGLPDFEDENFVSYTHNVLLRDEHVLSAGFKNSYIESEPHNGFLFKSIYVDDLYDVKITKHIVRTDAEIFAKVYIFQIGPLSSRDDVFDVLLTRAVEGLDTEANETNEYAEGSFYMNDTRRPNVAFLTTKIGSFIYAFSYPKQYHPYIKNLVILLDFEF